MGDEKRVIELADKATEGFFTELFKHLPASVTGDMPPDVTMAFETAARAAVAAIIENASREEYFVLYRVEWQPSAPGDDAPMDYDHSLSYNDERIKEYGIQGIGSAASVMADLARVIEERMGEEPEGT